MSRTSERTHPWLRFSVDLRRVPFSLWIMLGECQSKCEHIAGIPLRPETAKRLHLLYLARGTRATTAIEGNTLSEGQVLALLEGELRLPPSQQYLAREVENVVRACNRLLEEIREGRTPGLNMKAIEDLNRGVLDGLECGEGIVPGAIRSHEVRVGRYAGAPSEDCAYLVDRLCGWLDGEDFRPPSETLVTVFAILRAIVAHIYVAWIHPFGDGNGRTARLLEFQILIASGVPAPAAHLLSNHYYETRAEYYRQLDAASRSGGDILPYLEYAVRGLVDGLRQQIGVIREQQWEVLWRDHVHEVFAGEAGASVTRLRNLALSLPAGPVPIPEIPHLTPSLATAYARRSHKTLLRDVSALVARGLAKRDAAGVHSRREIILAFLPVRLGAETRRVDRESV